MILIGPSLPINDAYGLPRSYWLRAAVQVACRVRALSFVNLVWPFDLTEKQQQQPFRLVSHSPETGAK